MGEHISSYKQLFLVLIGLFILTFLTIQASHIDLGVLNVWIALAIASTKATLVLMFFMHLKYESKLLTIMLLITILFLAILIGFLFWDISYR